MPNSVGENQAKCKLAAGELVLCIGVNQMRTPMGVGLAAGMSPISSAPAAPM